jgi:hypothetical protein
LSRVLLRLLLQQRAGMRVRFLKNPLSNRNRRSARSLAPKPASGFFIFVRCKAREVNFAERQSEKEGQNMAHTTQHEVVSEEARELAHKAKRNSRPGWHISLDTWAVTLALALTALVWAGWIKRIPW